MRRPGIPRALRPAPLVREAVQLASEAVQVVRGTSSLAPDARDRRFADRAWTESPLYRRWAQGYVAVDQSVTRLLDEAERAGTDWRDLERLRFVLKVLVAAAAPTNTLLGNPAALKHAFDTGGRSLLRGAGHVVADLVRNGGLPTQTDRGAFAVGVDLALSPGGVVHRWPVAELLQYAPTTPSVRRRPC